MSAQEKQPDFEARVKRAEQACAEWQDALLQAIDKERQDLPRLETHATAVLNRQERFKGEWNIARDILALDIPRKRLRLAVLEQLACDANTRMRASVIFATPAQRDAIVTATLDAGGFYDQDGRFIDVESGN